MKKFAFFAILLVLPLAVAELGAFLLTRFDTALLGPSADEIEEVLDFEAYEKFLAAQYDPDLGWRNPIATAQTLENCIGEDKHYSWDEHGARQMNNDGRIDIIVIGDSYTFGHEVSDSETYPYRLQELIGLNVANYGVGGYGPLQAALQFERAIANHPETRIAILGVMNENIRRMPNQYRGVLNFAQNPFHFKPYVDVNDPELTVRTNPNTPPAETLEELRARAETSIESDYWWVPRPTFPYLLSIAQIPWTEVFSFFVRHKLEDRRTRFEFGEPNLEAGLRSVIERFVVSAKEHGVQPIVAFIPENKYDLATPNEMLAVLADAHPDTTMFNVGEATMDWDRFNLNGTVCHPSAYGYDQIARFISERLKGVLDEGMAMRSP